MRNLLFLQNKRLIAMSNMIDDLMFTRRQREERRELLEMRKGEEEEIKIKEANCESSSKNREGEKYPGCLLFVVVFIFISIATLVL